MLVIYPAKIIFRPWKKKYIYIVVFVIEFLTTGFSSIFMNNPVWVFTVICLKNLFEKACNKMGYCLHSWLFVWFFVLLSKVYILPNFYYTSFWDKYIPSYQALLIYSAVSIPSIPSFMYPAKEIRWWLC